MEQQIHNTLLSGATTILALRQRATRQITWIAAIVLGATLTVGMAGASFII